MTGQIPTSLLAQVTYFAEGDKVVARCAMSGTHLGPYRTHLGTLMPPTGKEFSVQANALDLSHISRILSRGVAQHSLPVGPALPPLHRVYSPA